MREKNYSIFLFHRNSITVVCVCVFSTSDYDPCIRLHLTSFCSRNIVLYFVRSNNTQFHLKRIGIAYNKRKMKICVKIRNAVNIHNTFQNKSFFGKSFIFIFAPFLCAFDCIRLFGTAIICCCCRFLAKHYINVANSA